MSSLKKLELNEGTDDHLTGCGYKFTSYGQFLNILLIIFTLGLILLIFYWKPTLRIKLLYRQCSIPDAQVFILEDKYQQDFVVKVTIQRVSKSLQSRYFHSSSTREAVRSLSPRANIKARDDVPEDEQSLLADSVNEYDSDVERAEGHKLPHHDGKVFRYLDHHNIRYIWHPELTDYVRLHGLDVGVRCMSLHDDYKGISELEKQSLQIIYGKNAIEVEVKSYVKLFFEEVMNPFYVFQIASVILWMSDDYYYYAACIIVISLMSIGVSLYETKKQATTLHDMVKTPEQALTVHRGHEVTEEVSNYELVPGDVIEIPSNGCTMLCDAVLLTGNCIVNEAMLTGESVPVTKTPLLHTAESVLFCPTEHKRHVLFSGTNIIQTRYYGHHKVKAVVIRTGFQTAKGELVRSIMFPKPMDFKFYVDAIRFILVLAVIASFGMALSIYIMIKYQRDVSEIIKRVLDIVTIVVPPALPAAMTVGMVYAQNRLKKANIFCISPPRINLCGKLKLFCFDKTGTLTEDGLDLWGMIPMVGDGLNVVYKDASELPRGAFISAMASCHSLTRIGAELNGDPLDLKMFEATGWALEEPGEDTSRFDTLMPTVVRPPHGREPPIEMFPGIEMSRTSIEMSTVPPNSPLNQSPYEIGIVKQFTFSSSLQRMSVITRTLGSSFMELYAKGAPEKISSLCLPETIPSNFAEVLKTYTMQGYRVIALAYKPLKDLSWHHAQRITRDQVEKDLTFTGLLVMQNALKPETTPIIKQLRRANIRTVMVTGDNILTAVSVARECGMIGKADRVVQVHAHPPDGDEPAKVEWVCHDAAPAESDGTDCEQNGSTSYQRLLNNTGGGNYHFTVDGKSFALLMDYFSDLMPKICLKGTVFARMGPNQKAQLVEQLQALGYGVGMCGDGANDCSALKAAHAGISLSEAEASVASPFTSKIQNISCVPTVIREGRAALTTSFGCFKYMALYSLIQFVTVLILYFSGSNLGDTQFLYIDLLITTTVAFLMGHTHAYHKLVSERPKGSLFSFSTLFSIFTQILVMGAIQLGAFAYLYRQPWFVPHQPLVSKGGGESSVTAEATTMFLVSSFQYIILAVNFSIGPPYRKRIWTNKPFFISVILLTLLSMLLLFYPPHFLETFLTMVHIDIEYYGFKIVLFLLICIHFLCSMIIETFLVNGTAFNKFSRIVRGKKLPRNKYKRLAMELEAGEEWPPIGKTIQA